MKTTHSISRWVYPFFWGVVIFNILRLTTDLLKDNSFWPGSLQQHFFSQFVVICMCYVFDIQWRNLLKKQRKKLKEKSSLWKEFGKVAILTFIPLNIIASGGEKIGVFHMGNGVIDYVILNIIFIPLFILYYIMIRTDIMNEDYIEQSLMLEKIKSKQLETELDYLKAQYHPHFLFNALNTVYFQIDEDNQPAKKTVELLSELLRYQLYDVSKVVTVSQEIEFIRTYIRFQQLRTTDRLVLNVHIDPLLKDQNIHPLLFQPLLENAFKYVGGDYNIAVDIEWQNQKIYFTVVNSISEIKPVSERNNKGIGIGNLKRRLQLLYPYTHQLETKKEKNSFFARLIIEPNDHGY